MWHRIYSRLSLYSSFTKSISRTKLPQKNIQRIPLLSSYPISSILQIYGVAMIPRPFSPRNPASQQKGKQRVCPWRNSTLYCTQWHTEGGGGGGNPRPPKFRRFDKAEPISQFRGKYTRNNLTRIRLSLIFWVVALPTSYDPHSGIFFLSKAWRDVSIRYQKLRKFYHMKWNFLYQITAASRTPD